MRHRSSTTALGDDARGRDAHTAADGEKLLDVLHFTYYVIRLQHGPSAVGQADLSGVIERLASGEKSTFRSAAELVGLLGAWAHPSEVTSQTPTG